MMAFAPSGRTRLFPVVGDPVDQVRSPAALTQLFAECGLDAAVVPMRVAAADLAGLLRALHAIGNLDGLLATVPHKQAALAEATTATDRARMTGAANVLRRTGDGWHGDNTDGQGFVDGLRLAGFDPAGKTALLAGCGGAGAAIGLELLARGAAQLTVHDIDPARRDRLVAALDRQYPGQVAVGSADPHGFDLVANATPMGMCPGDPLPVEAAGLAPGQFVGCVVTSPEPTPLIAAASQRGCATMSGHGMFDAQAQLLVDFLLAGREVGLKAGG